MARKRLPDALRPEASGPPEPIYPVLPLKDLVVYPSMVMPLFVSRPRSVRAIEEAMLHGQSLLLVAQRDAEMEDYAPEDLFEIGTIGQSLQLLRLPDGTLRIVIEGQKRARIVEWIQMQPFLKARVEEIEEGSGGGPNLEALVRTIQDLFQRAGELSRSIPPESLTAAANMTDPGRLADLIASNLSPRIEDRQAILETADVTERMEKLGALLQQEIEILELERKIHARVRNEIQSSQREIYLREQLKAIREELREVEGEAGEIEEYERKILECAMSEQAQEIAMRELGRLERMPAISPEGSVIRNYLDWLIELPWQRRTEDNLQLSRAEGILEEDHHGLSRVKERVLEFLAARKLAGEAMQTPILCFVGPPGVGKTSIGRSIARAMGRKFTRLSLGGVRDEAEIRGHRRTYIGSMPGRIMEAIRQTGVRNPIFMLDEIDKLGMDFRGDPASALLEVLDPEQNNTFSDHYLEIAWDLSEVMFITTANLLDPLPPALRDRMEVIEFDSYTEDEKLEIARKFLAKKQLKANGLSPAELSFARATLCHVVRYYTREAGVRNLERELARICRKVARQVATAGDEGQSWRRVSITPAALADYLGPRKFLFGTAERADQVGAALGLAWTAQGGSILTIEVAIVPGQGKLTLTGSLGDVMKESAEAALSYARARAAKLGVDPQRFREVDIHVHLPEGAVPKDGPSAGITIASALCSALAQVPVSRRVAMTGEITLRGRVLPIGGVKEKILAAHRAGVSEVILPVENRKDLVEVPQHVLQAMTIHHVKTMDEVLKLALRTPPRMASSRDRRAKAA